ncbi:uncharacterized protein LOC103726427 [Nannospalax galili]|uniref:uncharacterized protein LOC103726427 n=1 Tax=Nannospalax galili TaxID=1026970 RepID=UPI0004ED4064|nr:uncharacterized protein LOC103726427 [Nannospalax galili]
MPPPASGSAGEPERQRQKSGHPRSAQLPLARTRAPPRLARPPAPVSLPPTGAQTLGSPRAQAGRRRPAIPGGGRGQQSPAVRAEREGARAGAGGAGEQRRELQPAAAGRGAEGGTPAPAGRAPGPPSAWERTPRHVCSRSHSHGRAGWLTLTSAPGCKLPPVHRHGRHPEHTHPRTSHAHARQHAGSLRHPEPIAAVAGCFPTPPGGPRPPPPLRRAQWL